MRQDSEMLDCRIRSAPYDNRLQLYSGAISRQTDSSAKMSTRPCPRINCSVSISSRTAVSRDIHGKGTCQPQGSEHMVQPAQKYWHCDCTDGTSVKGSKLPSRRQKDGRRSREDALIGVVSSSGLYSSGHCVVKGHSTGSEPVRLLWGSVLGQGTRATYNHSPALCIGFADACACV